VRGLVERGAIGLVTTHDLALSEIVDDPGVRAVNVHFEDRLEDGQMVFDYRMRPGVVRTSNALALMRVLGLWSDGPAAARGVQSPTEHHRPDTRHEEMPWPRSKRATPDFTTSWPPTPPSSASPPA
jgi:DNA mismatch repair ATPase MutS